MSEKEKLNKMKPLLLIIRGGVPNLVHDFEKMEIASKDERLHYILRENNSELLSFILIKIKCQLYSNTFDIFP